MDEFLISYGGAELAFFDRCPPDTSEELEYFSLRILSSDLTAKGRVYGGYCSSHPAHLFAEMARQWDGWPGELVWTSLEGELTLRCSHDGLGHISICLDYRSGPMPDDWRVIFTAFADAGQLEGLAKRAAIFFGQPS